MNSKIKAELKFVFSQIHTHHLKLIPQNLIEDVEKNYDEEVFNKFKKSKPFTEQEMSVETLEILNDIFSKFSDEDFL